MSLVLSVARSRTAWDDNNKENVCNPNIPAGIKCPPPSKTISLITRFGTNSTVWINRVTFKVVNPARGQLNRKNPPSLSAFTPENLVSRDGFGSPVPRQPAHLYTQAESGAHLRDSSQVPWRRPYIYLKPPYAIGSVPSLSGHAIAYRWRSLPRVRRHRASKTHGSSERVLPWQVTMGQLICASLSHTHYWYEVSMLKLPYVNMYGHTYNKSMYQPGKAASPARCPAEQKK